MKKVICVVIAALACGMFACGAIAQWQDDFESYSDGLLPAPWDPVYLQYAASGTGWSGSVGCWKPDGLVTRGHAFRPAIGATNVYGKLLLTAGDYSDATVGLTTNNTHYVPGDAWFGCGTGSDSVHMSLYWDQVVPHLSPGMALYAANRNDETGAYLGSVRQLDLGLEYNKWYDVRIELSGGDATGYYRAEDAPPGTWINRSPILWMKSLAGSICPQRSRMNAH